MQHNRFYTLAMNAQELRRALKKAGCTFTTQGKGGHITVHYKGKHSILPMHGSSKELKPGLVHAIYKQLGLKR